MPLNCKAVTVEHVLKFFEEEIDGMGKHDGHPRNEGLPESITLWKSASLCDLTEDEFTRLIIPQDPHILLTDKDLATIEGEDSIFTFRKYLYALEQGKNLPELIIRNILPHDLKNSSFYIEDGAHKAL